MRDFGNLLFEESVEQSSIISVSDINARIARMFDDEPDFAGISVMGEVADLRRYGSGHWYFTLKDDRSQLKAVMFRSAAAKQAALGFIPENGLLVVAYGDIRVYEPNGVYQIVAQSLAPAGEGARYAAFLRLKDKLLKEGLLDQARKKPLPSFIKDIALITSPSSAAARDFIKISKARWQGIRITIVPATMQGATAPASVAEALDAASRLREADVVVIARGGGSSEDLWCFNDEGLARAIAAMERPVVTGIGHEVDFTIADFVADVRASTPSNAAELLVPDASAIAGAIGSVAGRLTGRLTEIAAAKRALLESMVSRGPLARPMDMVDLRRQAVDDMESSIRSAARRHVFEAGSRLKALEASVMALNPASVLDRGYSVCALPDGTVVRSYSQAPSGARVEVRLKHGTLGCEVVKSGE